ncbi:hypothetical protein [Wolbachia endosymbiont of Brugia pahangi]|uniref:hypothetical protein n=1 Tax=Wolbachia endosymbiont of Brugia pahangi TaxID=96495 RepID=UPI001439B217|nr:hypothetical protein [Wolbachia endosymbiont of Brugia pahangi]
MVNDVIPVRDTRILVNLFTIFYHSMVFQYEKLVSRAGMLADTNIKELIKQEKKQKKP